MDLSHVDLSTVMTLVSALLLPFVVDLVTKMNAPASFKRDVALVLTVLAGVLPTVAYDPHTGWAGYLLNVVLALAASQGLHRTGITDAVERATADTGLGKVLPFPTPPTEPGDLVVPPAGNPGDVGDTTPAAQAVA